MKGQIKLDEISAAEYKAAQKKKYQKQIKDFHNFKRNTILDQGNKAYIRINDEVVQTSKGLVFKLDHCITLAKIWASNPSKLKGKHIGSFTIEQSTKTFIKSGCHKIYYKDNKQVFDKLIKM